MNNASALLSFAAISLVAACGGGGGGSGGVAMATIDSANAPVVAAGAMQSAVATNGVAGASGFGNGVTPAGFAGNHFFAEALIRHSGRLSAPGQRQIQSVVGPSTIDCAVAGTVLAFGNTFTDGTLSPGDVLTGIFDNCDDGDGLVANGTVNFIVRAFQGDLPSEVYRLTVEATLSSFAVTDSAGTSTGNGTLSVTLDTTASPQVVGQVSGTNFRISTRGRTYTLFNLSSSVTLDESVIPFDYTEEVSGALAVSGFAGNVDIETVTPFQGSGGDPPSIGEMLITGANNASVRLVTIDSTNVQLQIDTDGDGIVDETQDSTWAALGF